MVRDLKDVITVCTLPETPPQLNVKLVVDVNKGFVSSSIEICVFKVKTYVLLANFGEKKSLRVIIMSVNKKPVTKKSMQMIALLGAAFLNGRLGEDTSLKK